MARLGMEGKSVPNRSAKASFDAVPCDSVAEFLGNRKANPCEIEFVREDLQRETRLGNTDPAARSEKIRSPSQGLKSYADRRFRPFDRRFARTLRPPTVDLRAKYP